MNEERAVYHTAHAESETSGPEVRVYPPVYELSVMYASVDGQVRKWDEERQCWVQVPAAKITDTIYPPKIVLPDNQLLPRQAPHADTSADSHVCICRICGCTWDRTTHA